MAILPQGAFSPDNLRARRGVNATGLAGMFGQTPEQRRAQTPFGNPNMLGAKSGRRRGFEGGVFGPGMGSRSSFGRGSSSLDFGGIFDNLSWDPNTGLRVSNIPGAVGDALGGSGAIGSPGGDWSMIDRWDAEVAAAAKKWGIDPNRLKAHMRIESGGDPNAVQNNPLGNTVGLMQINPNIWGGVLSQNGINIYTPAGNIEGAAWILSDLKKRYGSDDAASSAYFTGNPNWIGVDVVNGTTGQTYQSMLNQYISELNQSGGGGSALRQHLTGGGGGGGWGTGVSGNEVVDLATQYVGVAYNWGSIPGASQDPWQTGWDCSGMIKWLSDKMGGGVPAGSHLQYQWAQQTGRLYNNAGQLRPGDLVFMDTGGRAGGGANLNGASHVGMYIGNGQMIHAANPSVGTIISSLSDPYYAGKVLGYASMDWSGGSGVPAGAAGGGQQQPQQQRVQASNGAYYSPGYQIPSRLRR